MKTNSSDLEDVFAISLVRTSRAINEIENAGRDSADRHYQENKQTASWIFFIDQIAYANLVLAHAQLLNGMARLTVAEKENANIRFQD